MPLVLSDNSGGEPESVFNDRPRSSDPLSGREDQRLCFFVLQLGESSCTKIAARLPGRTARQCRERWRHYLQGPLPERPWAPEEELLLSRAVGIHSLRWHVIGHLFWTRTDLDLRRHWICRNVDKITIENGPKSYGWNQRPDPESESQLAAKIWNAQSGFWFDIEPDSQYSEFY
jgi:hypothetical protein